MRRISEKNKRLINSDSYFRVCARRGFDCSGRITIDHVFLYAGRQIDELWNFLPVCWYHHLGEGLNKEINKYKTLKRIEGISQMAELYQKYPKVEWLALRTRLINRYEKI